MEVAANDLEWQIKQADADLQDTRVKLESQKFDQQSVVEGTESDMKQAELNKDRDQQLLKLNLKADMDAQISKANWEKLVAKYKIEKQKLDIMKDSIDAQMDSKKSRSRNSKRNGPQEETGG